MKLKIFTTVFFLLSFTVIGIAQNKKEIIGALTLKVDSLKIQNEALKLENNKQDVNLKHLGDTLDKQSTEILYLKKYLDYLKLEMQTKVNAVEILKNQKTEIDSFIVHNPKNCIVFVKLIDQKELLKIENENWPETEKIETTFNVYKNNSGGVISIREFPESQSGDWNERLTHYFDKDTKTFAFERNFSFFNNDANDCKAEVIYETRIEYFNNRFSSIGNEYKLFDKDDKDLRGSDCDLSRGFDFKITSELGLFSWKYNLKTE